MPFLHKYYLEEFFDEQFYTAGIVVKDNEAILAGEGFKPLRFRQYKNGPILLKLQRFINAFTLAIQCKKNSVVFFHFPMEATLYSLLHNLLKWRGAKTAAIIIDIDGMRDKDEILLEKEIIKLSKFNYVIAHNDAMKNLLLQYPPAAKIFTIDLFDYPVKEAISRKIFSKTICIAANFSKAKYVYELNKFPQLTFNLYGQGFDTGNNKTANNIFYKGIISPHELPAKLEGSFGLVWDGNSIENCDEYLTYNNPHKLSLYLAAGLPVIVWKGSAAASLVEKNNIGITINSIMEVDKVLTAITKKEYESMQRNTLPFATKISQGYYLKNAVSKIIAEIN